MADNPILAQARKEQETTEAATATPNVDNGAATSSDINSALVSAPSTAPVSDSLLAVQDAAGKAVTRSVEAVIQLESGAKRNNTATSVITQSISDITAANQIIQRTKDTANLQAQNATIDAFEVGGGTDAQVALMRELNSDNDAISAILEENAILASEDRFGEGQGLLDNIINQFNINLNRTKLRAAEAKRANTERQISNTSAATESFARVNAVTKQTLNEATIEANYKAIGAEGDLKAAEAEIANINSNASAMLNLMNADSRVTSNLLQSYKLEGEAEDRAIKAERQKFLREQMNHEREQWRLSAPKAKLDLQAAQLRLTQAQSLGPTQIAQAEFNLAKAQKQQSELETTQDSLVTSVQRGQALSGVPVDDRSTILWGLGQSGVTGVKYNKLQELGGSPDPVLGLNPAEAKANLDEVAPSGNIKRSKATKLLAQVAELQATKYAQPTATVPRDQVSLDADFNQTAKELAATFAATIAVGDASNPYSAPPFSVLESSVDLQLQPLYSKVLKPMAMKETNPQTIVDAAIAGVLAKTVSPEEAASGIAAVFDLAALYNNTLEGGFRRVGLPNQTTYNVKLDRQPTFFEQLKLSAGVLKPDVVLGTLGLGKLAIDREGVLGKTTVSVDLMDKTAVQKLVIEALSSTRLTQAPGTSVSNP